MNKNTNMTGGSEYDTVVGHLTCVSPSLKRSTSRSLDWAAGVGAGATHCMAALAATNPACCALPTPFERGWIPIPGFGNSLEPDDDLIRIGLD